MTTLPQTSSLRVPQPIGAGVPGPFTGAAPSTGVGFQLDGATVRRVIRTNIWLILAMVVLFTALGYVANLMLLRYFPLYQAEGILQVVRSVTKDPVREITHELTNEQLITEQRTQANLLKTDELFSKILRNEKIRKTDWFKQFLKQDSSGNLVPDTARAKQLLKDDFNVLSIADSALMRAQMKARNPDNARVIVEEIVETHLAEQRNTQLNKVNEDTRTVREIERRFANQLDAVNKRIRDKQEDLVKRGMAGPGFRSIKEIELTELVKSQIELSSKKNDIIGEFETIRAEIESGLPIARIEKEIDQDPFIQRSTQELVGYETNKQLMGDNVGPEAMAMKRIDKAIEVTRSKIENYRNTQRVKLREFLIQMMKAAKDRVERDHKQITDLVEATRADLAGLGRETVLLEQDQNLEETLRKKHDDASTRLENLTNVSSLQNQVRIAWASRPENPELPYFPRLYITMGIAIFLGMALSLGIAFLREFLDDTVRSPRDVTRVGQMNLLGMIADENDDPQVADAKLPIFDAPHSLTAEQFRQVRTRLQHAASLDTMRSIMVTGPSPQDGKTTVAANLAAGLALNGRKILLVDGNFRRPEIHRLFGFTNEKGFADVLNGTVAFEDVVHETRVPNLSVMTSGPKPMNAAELFESQLLLDFIERSVEDFDHVIFDTGPLLIVSESTAMAPRVDGVVTVIRAHSESRGLLQRMRDELRRIKAEHVGVVLNAVRAQGGGYYRRNIKTYYQYQSEA